MKEFLEKTLRQNVIMTENKEVYKKLPLLSSRTRGTVSEMLLVSTAMILLLCVIEYIYMRVVKHSSDRYLLTLMQSQREE